SACKEVARRIQTTDPITLNTVEDPESHPFIIEGEGANALKVYFESEENKKAYLEIDIEHRGQDMETNLNNPAKGRRSPMCQPSPFVHGD
ncbi:MAG: hypothetical protein O6950_06600, partial [Gammaproteobacteria bacterium]|nr:hypothetical protein [Gammaproteobacteria bacterium]